jgi:drug/metabolite transporter (DMT)-like permease
MFMFASWGNGTNRNGVPYSAVCAVGAALFATFGTWHLPRLGNIGLLLALGVFATLGQLTITRAYRRGDTVVVASLAYSTVIFGSLLDALIWNQTLPPVAWVGSELLSPLEFGRYC